MNNAVHGKTTENLKNRFAVRLVSNKNRPFEWTSKPSSMTQKIFGNDLVAIYKIKVTLMLKE